VFGRVICNEGEELMGFAAAMRRLHSLNDGGGTATSVLEPKHGLVVQSREKKREIY
jgi:hypothetical protein